MAAFGSRSLGSRVLSVTAPPPGANRVAHPKRERVRGRLNARGGGEKRPLENRDTPGSAPRFGPIPNHSVATRQTPTTSLGTNAPCSATRGGGSAAVSSAAIAPGPSSAWARPRASDRAPGDDRPFGRIHSATTTRR